MKNRVETPKLTVETAKKLVTGLETDTLEAVRKAEGIHGRTWKALVSHAVFHKPAADTAFAILREGLLMYLLKDNEVVRAALQAISGHQIKTSVKVSTVHSLTKAEKEYLISQGHADFVEASEAENIATLRIEKTITDEPPPVPLISRLLDMLDRETLQRLRKK